MTLNLTPRRSAASLHAIYFPLEDLGRTQQVYERLKNAIISGALRVGERLPTEPELGRRLGVATVTVREALDALRVEGLVQTKRGRSGGTFVSSSNADQRAQLDRRLATVTSLDLREASEHYRAIVVAVAELAATRASSREVDALEQVIREIDYSSELALRDGEARFRTEAATFAQSARLVREEMTLQVSVASFLWLSFADPAIRETVRACHADFVAAVRFANPEGARSAASLQIQSMVTTVIRLKRAGDDSR